MTLALNFSPGVTVFIMDQVSFNVSFGVFGVKMHHERQTTDGVEEGSRFASGANFKFNIFNIKFGVAAYICPSPPDSVYRPHHPDSNQEL